MPNKDFHFTRRRFVGSGLAMASALQIAQAARAFGFTASGTGCSLMAEQEVGPFYVAGELLRSEIAEGKAGVPLALRILVLHAATCQPLVGAAIDVWHCDALGLYSGFTAQNGMGPGGPGGPGRPGEFAGRSAPGGPPPDFPPPDGGDHAAPDDHDHAGPPFASHPSDKLTFLRGIQLTGIDGSASFRTVFPGFYMGRTNHIHFKVRLGGQEDGKSYQAGHTSHVGQVFFPEALATELMQHEPYSAHQIHRVTQQEDQIFTAQHGDLSIAHLTPITPGKFAEGLQAELVVAVDPAATPTAVGMRGRK
jgi:protocatechuate 3,4-dioxygenase beta subunit